MVALARTKLETLSDGDVTANEAVSDQRVLTELITSLGQARSVIKARAALNRALARKVPARSRSARIKHG